MTCISFAGDFGQIRTGQMRLSQIGYVRRASHDYAQPHKYICPVQFLLKLIHTLMKLEPMLSLAILLFALFSVSTEIHSQTRRISVNIDHFSPVSLPNFQEFSTVYRRTVNPDLIIYVDIPQNIFNYAYTACNECLQNTARIGGAYLISAVYHQQYQEVLPIMKSYLVSCLKYKLRTAYSYGYEVVYHKGDWKHITTPGRDLAPRNWHIWRKLKF